MGSQTADKFDYRLLEAQLHTVTYLHMYLPMYPAAWIARKLDKSFVDIYVKSRTRFNTLKVAVAALATSLVLPRVYSRTLMAYPCREVDVRLVDPVRNGTAWMTHESFQETGCEVEDWLRSWEGSWLLGPVILLGSFSTMAAAIAICKRIRHLQYRALLWAKPLLPHIFYNGMGPAGSPHCAKVMFSSADLESHYSCMHDLLGSVDLIVFCISLALALLVAFVGLGAYVDGLSGASIGAVAGSFLARYMLKALNYFLGASDELVSYVKACLRNRSPHRKFLRNENTVVDDSKIREEVDATVRLLEGGMGVDARDMPKVLELAGLIKEQGHDVIKGVAEWLLKHREELPCCHGSCYDLFKNVGTTFSGSEHMLAALSFLDVTMFLVTYFDPSWRVIKLFQPPWGQNRIITKFFLSNPRYAMCQLKGDRWEILPLDAVRKSLGGSVDGDDKEESRSLL